VIKCNNNLLHLQWLGRKRQGKKKINKYINKLALIKKLEGIYVEGRGRGPF
jgi:hypothetical protein